MFMTMIAIYIALHINPFVTIAIGILSLIVGFKSDSNNNIPPQGSI